MTPKQLSLLRTLHLDILIAVLLYDMIPANYIQCPGNLVFFVVREPITYLYAQACCTAFEDSKQV